MNNGQFDYTIGNRKKTENIKRIKSSDKINNKSAKSRSRIKAPEVGKNLVPDTMTSNGKGMLPELLMLLLSK